jgi:hypothetical protein
MAELGWQDIVILLDLQGFDLEFRRHRCSRPLSVELQEERWVALSIAPLLLVVVCYECWVGPGVTKTVLVVAPDWALSGVLLWCLPWGLGVGLGPNRTALTVGKMGI